MVSWNLYKCVSEVIGHRNHLRIWLHANSALFGLVIQRPSAGDGIWWKPPAVRCLWRPRDGWRERLGDYLKSPTMMGTEGSIPRFQSSKTSLGSAKYAKSWWEWAATTVNDQGSPTTWRAKCRNKVGDWAPTNNYYCKNIYDSPSHLGLNLFVFF